MLLWVAVAKADSGGRQHGGLLSRMAGAMTEATAHAIDIDAILDEVDVNELVERIDINELVARIDIDALVQRIDIDTVVQKIDIDALVSRIDMNALLEDVDIPALVERAGIADIVAESTGTMAGSVLDIVRRQLVALDEIVGRIAYGLVRRDPLKRPSAPAMLRERVGDERTEQGRAERTGYYAGPVTRAAAFALDIVIIFAAVTLMGTGAAFISRVFGIDINTDGSGNIVGAIFLVLAAFSYFAFSLAIAARTIGQGIVGLRVVARDGSPMHGRQALVRTAVEPFSFLFFGLGCLVMLVSPERRTLHDAAARTAVVYDWGDRPADIPAPLAAWIETRQEQARSESD